jgi:dUTP pyrophosphatase
MEIKTYYRDGYEPTYATEGASGIDLKATEDCCIEPGKFKSVDLSLKMIIPKGYEMQIRPRSGLMFKLGVMGGLGTIDSDYRGYIKAILFNFSDEYFYIHKGDRICQGVFSKIEHVTIKRVTMDEFDKDITDRGNGGFGSTGIN